MMFLQFFIWGSWFVTMGPFLDSNLGADGSQIGLAYGTQSWGAIIAPFIIGLVADIMDWNHIRFCPVESEKGKLIGLVSMRMINRYYNQNQGKTDAKVTVQDLMIKKPITISPESTIVEAMNLMREHHIGCLPVIKKDRLVGIVTEGNFLNITATLLKIMNQSGPKNQ